MTNIFKNIKLSESNFVEGFLRRYNGLRGQHVPCSTRNTNLPFILGYKARFGLPAQKV